MTDKLPNLKRFLGDTYANHSTDAVTPGPEAHDEVQEPRKT